MKLFERLLLWVPLIALLGAPLAGGASEAVNSAAPSAPDATQSGDATPSKEAEAKPAEPAPRPSGRVDLSSASEREAWVKRIGDAYRAVDDAKQRQDQAVIGYGKARHKRKTRGEAKREVLEERQESRDAVAEAESNLEKTLEEARRAGVPPGWLREAQAGSGPANRN